MSQEVIRPAHFLSLQRATSSQQSENEQVSIWLSDDGDEDGECGDGGRNWDQVEVQYTL